jgi:DNA-nicking Smr family endonuclease
MPRVRKVRRLSEDEAALWRRVVETVRPRQPAEAAGADPEPAAAPAQPAPGRVRTARAAAPSPAPLPAAPQMDRRRFEKLRRGRLEPEARLDLHGMTSERAHAALTRFILAAHADGLRLVLVITGKGREGPADAMPLHRHGVLRHSVPHWLATPPLTGRVLQVAPAHRRHGGVGACYVYLRRNRG